MKKKTKDKAAHVAGDTCLSRSYLDCVEFLEGAFEQAYNSGDNEVLTHEGIADALKRVKMIDDAILELYGDAPEGLFDELNTHFDMVLYWIWLWGYAAGITKYQSVLKNVSDECKEVRENESLAVINPKEFSEECSLDIATRTYDLRQSLDKIFGSLLFIAEAMAKEKAAQAHEPSKGVNDGGGKASKKRGSRYVVTQEKMADMMGVSVQTIKRWEKNPKNIPNSKIVMLRNRHGVEYGKGKYSCKVREDMSDAEEFAESYKAQFAIKGISKSNIVSYVGDAITAEAVRNFQKTGMIRTQGRGDDEADERRHGYNHADD